MSLSSVLADSIARIRNAQAVMLKEVVLLYSGLLLEVLRVMEEEGYILGFEQFEISKGVMRLNVRLKYYNNVGVISDFKFLSKPGRRVYVPCDGMKKLYDGLGTLILSTSKGVVTDKDAVKLRVGGELLCGLF